MSMIGLIGVPLETVPIRDTGLLLPFYLPGITNKTRGNITDKCKEIGIEIDDLGEADLGEYYEPGFKVDRMMGIYPLSMERLKGIDMKKLIEARDSILQMSREYPLLLCIGTSHLGAITLYEDGDTVARLDYHADYTGWSPSRIAFGYASYMDWVKQNVPNVDVINHFVRWSENGSVFGRRAENEDRSYVDANHFDIDVDCFHGRYGIQNIHVSVSEPAIATPELVVSMIRKTHPNKIGIWEYRPFGDYLGNGLRFIVDSIVAALP